MWRALCGGVYTIERNSEDWRERDVEAVELAIFGPGGGGFLG